MYARDEALMDGRDEQGGDGMHQEVVVGHYGESQNDIQEEFEETESDLILNISTQGNLLHVVIHSGQSRRYFVVVDE